MSAATSLLITRRAKRQPDQPMSASDMRAALARFNEKRGIKNLSIRQAMAGLNNGSFNQAKRLTAPKISPGSVSELAHRPGRGSQTPTGGTHS